MNIPIYMCNMCLCAYVNTYICSHLSAHLSSPPHLQVQPSKHGTMHLTNLAPILFLTLAAGNSLHYQPSKRYSGLTKVASPGCPNDLCGDKPCPSPSVCTTYTRTSPSSTLTTCIPAPTCLGVYRKSFLSPFFFFFLSFFIFFPLEKTSIAYAKD